MKFRNKKDSGFIKILTAENREGGMCRGSVRKYLVVSIFIFFHLTTVAQIGEDGKLYTVQSGEDLIEIAEKLGDRDFWKPLYQANTDLIDEGIEAGQVLTIPEVVTGSPKFAHSLPAENSTDPVIQTEAETLEDKDLEKFRAAFNKVIKQQKEKENNKQNEQPDQVDPELDLGVLILDETRSKLGGDFYNLFYQNWRAPENASNITITIAEQPSFGRGTQVSVKIDYDQVFAARLQPRYEYIQAASKQAVSRAQRQIQQQAEVRQQLTGY